MSGDGLRLDCISRQFSETTRIGQITLDVGSGEIVALTGPSGTGKTTVCRMISGLERPDTGHITLNGEALDVLPVQKRCIAYMFESYALYPHLSVLQNIAFPLRAPNRKKLPLHEEKALVRDLMEIAQIAHLGDRKPGALSGGQKQRVALCRCLVQDASIFLLDEPISHLDAKLRNELRGWIRRRQTKLSAPTLWSTPDAMEALSVADRVAVLIGGKIAQLGTPEEIYFKPATTDVARLVGDPSMNLIEGKLSDVGGQISFIANGISVRLPQELAARTSKVRGPKVILGIRPSAVALGGADARLRVYSWEPFGRHSIINARLDETPIRIKTPPQGRFDVDQMIDISIEPANVVLFDGTTRKSI